MQNAKGGTLRVRLIEANLTRDTETFSKMDPYVNIIYNAVKVGKTKTLDGAGKKPKWNQSFEIQIMDIMDDIYFEVKDEDLTSSDLIGTLKCKIFNILGPNNGMAEWHDITYHGKRAGKIHLDTAWTPKGGNAQAAAPQ